jgi:hypothetical protein
MKVQGNSLRQEVGDKRNEFLEELFAFSHQGEERIGFDKPKPVILCYAMFWLFFE